MIRTYPDELMNPVLIFAPMFNDAHPIHLSLLGKTGTGKTITMLYLLHHFVQLCRQRNIPFRQYHL
jgi:Cdc6-like AAA superfamily ATPase